MLSFFQFHCRTSKYAKHTQTICTVSCGKKMMSASHRTGVPWVPGKRGQIVLANLGGTSVSLNSSTMVISYKEGLKHIMNKTSPQINYGLG